MRTLKQFIEQQPAERPVDFSSSYRVKDGDCGCVLVHYGREELKMSGEINAGFDNVREHGTYRPVYSVHDRSFCMRVVSHGCSYYPPDYGTLRQILGLEQQEAQP